MLHDMTPWLIVKQLLYTRESLAMHNHTVLFDMLVRVLKFPDRELSVYLQPVQLLRSP